MAAQVEKAEERLLTIPEVAERLSCGRDTVYQLMRSGELRALKVGKRLTRFRPGEVERYIERQAKAW